MLPQRMVLSKPCRRPQLTRRLTLLSTPSRRPLAEWQSSLAISLSIVPQFSRGYAQGPGGGQGGFPGFAGFKPQHQKGEALKEYVGTR